MSIDLFDLRGKVKGKVSLPKAIFGVDVNKKLLAQAVRVYLANQRQGTVSTKTRSEITGTTKKVWRQKGTGRARRGSRKAPIFVGGGVTFAPKPRDFSLKLSKKMKKQALFSALSSKIQSKEIKAVAGLEKIEAKTKNMADAIKKLGVDGKKRSILMITPGKIQKNDENKTTEKTSSKDELQNLMRASKNIEGLRVIAANMLNSYDVLNNKMILLMEKSIEDIKENFLGGSK